MHKCPLIPMASFALFSCLVKYKPLYAPHLVCKWDIYSLLSDKPADNVEDCLTHDNTSLGGGGGGKNSILSNGLYCMLMVCVRVCECVCVCHALTHW